MTKRETAETLAKAHFEVEPNLRRVFVLERGGGETPDEPIALLEVVEGTIERGIEPIAFTADLAHGIPYPSVIVEVSPKEYEDIRNSRLDFGPHGWRLGEELKAS
jgi:hypothetical protein